ncbi:uncharacterized protein LOC126803566 [Argentina anserina]|uniref:uncharacterized protein LOC126803566 n=1 Tax=Argentina anserina TaxID=57926 RepID=UPI0021762CC4|nr:uncharacterized protein LOC126803566 [Potentilla anserina]
MGKMGKKKMVIKMVRFKNLRKNTWLFSTKSSKIYPLPVFVLNLQLRLRLRLRCCCNELIWYWCITGILSQMFKLDILKNLKHHKDEDILKGQALKNQKILSYGTKLLSLGSCFRNHSQVQIDYHRNQLGLNFCGSHEDVKAAYSDLVASSKKTLNSLLELQEAFVEKNPSISQDSTNGNSAKSIGVDGDDDWSRISNLLSRMATFRNKEIDKWQTRAQVNTGAASIKARLHAFNQTISQQVAAYMRDPIRMVKQMQMKQSEVGVFGTVSKGDDTPKEEELPDAAVQADSDAELLDDLEFYQQLLKEFFETIDPTSSGKTLELY